MELLPYQRNPDWGWERWMALTLVAGVRSGWGLVGVVVVVLIGALTTLLYILLTRVWTIYRSHAFISGDSGVKRVLWWAVSIFLSAVLIAGTLILATPYGVWGLYLASWSTLCFVVVIEWCDRQARAQQQQAARQLGNAEPTLADFISFNTPTK